MNSITNSSPNAGNLFVIAFGSSKTKNIYIFVHLSPTSVNLDPSQSNHQLLSPGPSSKRIKPTFEASAIPRPPPEIDVHYDAKFWLIFHYTGWTFRHFVHALPIIVALFEMTLTSLPFGKMNLELGTKTLPKFFSQQAVPICSFPPVMISDNIRHNCDAKWFFFRSDFLALCYLHGTRLWNAIASSTLPLLETFLASRTVGNCRKPLLENHLSLYLKRPSDSRLENSAWKK